MIIVGVLGVILVLGIFAAFIFKKLKDKNNGSQKAYNTNVKQIQRIKSKSFEGGNSTDIQLRQKIATNNMQFQNKQQNMLKMEQNHQSNNFLINQPLQTMPSVQNIQKLKI